MPYDILPVHCIGERPSTTSAPPCGAIDPPATASSAPATGTSIAAPGKTVCASNVTAAHRITATPAQLITTPAIRGTFSSHGDTTASSAPAASSDARGSGEKYAVVRSTDVRCTEYANDAAIIRVSATPSLSRIEIPFATDASSRISSGQTK